MRAATKVQLEKIRCVVTLSCGAFGAMGFWGFLAAAAAKYLSGLPSDKTMLVFGLPSGLICVGFLIYNWREFARATGFDPEALWPKLSSIT